MVGVGYFDFYKYVVMLVVNVICVMCFGRRYDYDDEELFNLINLNNEFGEVVVFGNSVDFIFIFRYLFNFVLDIFKDLNKKFYIFM